MVKIQSFFKKCSKNGLVSEKNALFQLLSGRNTELKTAALDGL